MIGGARRVVLAVGALVVALIYQGDARSTGGGDREDPAPLGSLSVSLALTGKEERPEQRLSRRPRQEFDVQVLWASEIARHFELLALIAPHRERQRALSAWNEPRLRRLSEAEAIHDHVRPGGIGLYEGWAGRAQQGGQGQFHVSRLSHQAHGIHVGDGFRAADANDAFNVILAR